MKQNYRGHLLLESCIALSLITAVALVFLSSAVFLIKQQRRRETILELYRYSYESVKIQANPLTNLEISKEINGNNLSLKFITDNKELIQFSGQCSEGDFYIELERKD